MRIALYGGSFNPPHLSHQLACTVALAAASPPVDEVWMVPAFQHAFGKPLAPFEDRVALCELATRSFGERVRVSRVEEELGGASYTQRTVQELRRRTPGLDIVIVIGSDLVEERARWHRWSELREEVSFLVIGRRGAEAPAVRDLAAARDQIIPIELPQVSSTEVRRRIAAGESTAGLIDERVRAAIDARGLYR